jgi:hypothetical protein
MAIDDQDGRTPRQLTLRGIQTGDPEVPFDPVDSYGSGDLPEMSDKQKKILKDAQKKFERCQKFYSISRARQLDDLKFAEADSYNGYQWPNDIKAGRDINQQPSLTVNKTRQHNLIIINDQKKHKASMKFRPVGNGATSEAATIWDALARHIENQSSAEAAYSKGSEFQVKTGFGAWRITTKYIDDETFDQDIFIMPIPDPRVIYIDPDCKQADKSDMKFAFLFEDVTPEVLNQRFPQFHGHAPQAPLQGSSHDSWILSDKIRIAEYFRRVTTKDVLWSYDDPQTGEMKGILQSEMPKELIKAQIANKDARSRVVETHIILYYLIIGNRIMEEKVWPGKYIPIVPILGEETMIDGNYDCKGHTRALLDSQRMFNYWASAAVEYGALQNKIPYVAPASAIEGLQGYWDTANIENYSVLPYNHIDDDGNPIPKPERQQPPMSGPLYMEGMEQALKEMELVSGQYNNQMGQQGNERTGKAIQERQRQSDTATYHFVDNQAMAIRYTGMIIKDLIPKIYDTKRVMHILDIAGKSIEVTIDPDAKAAYTQELNEDAQAVKRVLNPAIGTFDVYADVGPEYATMQEEGWDSFLQILTQSPQLVTLIGDLALRNANFPMANEAADRMERMVPSQAKGNGPTVAEQHLQAENKALQAELQKLQQQVAKQGLQLVGKDQMREIDAYEAETKRIAAMQAALPTDPEALRQMIEQLAGDTMQTHLAAFMNAQNLINQAGVAGQPGGPNGQDAPQAGQPGMAPQGPGGGAPAGPPMGAGSPQPGAGPAPALPQLPAGGQAPQARPPVGLPNGVGNGGGGVR